MRLPSFKNFSLIVTPRPSDKAIMDATKPHPSEAKPAAKVPLKYPGKDRDGFFHKMRRRLEGSKSKEDKQTQNVIEVKHQTARQHAPGAFENPRPAPPIPKKKHIPAPDFNPADFATTNTEFLQSIPAIKDQQDLFIKVRSLDTMVKRTAETSGKPMTEADYMQLVNHSKVYSASGFLTALKTIYLPIATSVQDQASYKSEVKRIKKNNPADRHAELLKKMDIEKKEQYKVTLAQLSKDIDIFRHYLENYPDHPPVKLLKESYDLFMADLKIRFREELETAELEELIYDNNALLDHLDLEVAKPAAAAPRPPDIS